MNKSFNQLTLNNLDFGTSKFSIALSISFPSWRHWGYQNENVSSLKLYFQAKVGRKKQLPHVIECVCYESPAVMTYLYDAFQQQPSRNMLRLHPSLAPYKTAFAVDSSG